MFPPLSLKVADSWRAADSCFFFDETTTQQKEINKIRGILPLLILPILCNHLVYGGHDISTFTYFVCFQYCLRLHCIVSHVELFHLKFGNWKSKVSKSKLWTCVLVQPCLLVYKAAAYNIYIYIPSCGLSQMYSSENTWLKIFETLLSHTTVVCSKSVGTGTDISESNTAKILWG